MPMPAYVTLVEVVDLADFSRVVARRVFKSRQAANSWGSQEVDKFAHAANLRGDDLISFDYHTQSIVYLDN